MRKPPILAVPDRAHPLVKRLFTIMREEQIGVVEMAERTGINKNTLKDWRTRTSPKLVDIEACFTVLGKRLALKDDD